MSSDKKDILAALEKMEEASKKLNDEKAKEEARLKKFPRMVEPGREERIRVKAQEDLVQRKNNVWINLISIIFFSCGYLAFLYWYADRDRVQFVFYIIVSLVFYGFYVMYLNSRK